MENKLLKGAKIATISLIIVKALGVLYIIPMNAMLSSESMALYGASYVIYALFTQLTDIGFPVGVSKLVSKFRTEENYNMVNKTFKYSITVIAILGLIMFLTLFFGAPFINERVNENSTFNPEQMIASIRILSFTLLVIPFLSISRGYTQGFEDMRPSSNSMVMEQLVRVIIILGGIFLSTRVFHLDEIYAIYIATAASFFSAFIGYWVLLPGFRKYHKQATNKKDDSHPDVTFRKVVFGVAVTSVPFIILSTYRGVFDFINITSIDRVLNNFDVSDSYIKDTVTIYSIYIQKLVILVLTISTGFSMSIIPSITALNASGKKELVKERITQIALLTFFVTLFISVFTAIYNKETFLIFFGYNELGSSVFVMSVLSTVIFAVLFVFISCLITLNHPYIAAFAMAIGIVTKVISLPILTTIFTKFSIEPAFIFITSSLVGYFFSLGFVLTYIIHKHFIIVRVLVKNTLKIIISALIIGIFIYFEKYLGTLILKQLFDVTISYSKLLNLVYLAITGVIAMVVYFFIAEKLGYLKDVSGFEFKSLSRKLKRG